MPRPTFADPKTDFAFKRIFGSEEHKDVLVAFLDDMLALDGPHRIASVELLPPEQRPPVAELKLSIVDVKCTDARGVTYVVEMQVLQVEGFEKRVVCNVEDGGHSATDSAPPSGAPPPLSGLRPPSGGHYNVAKAYVNQIASGELYPTLNDVVGITICDFELWPDNEERRIRLAGDAATGRAAATGAPIPMLSRWSMTEQHSGSNELGQIWLVFLELPKYDVSRPPQTVVEKWAYFFREADNLAVVPEALADHPFVDALEAARTAGFSEAEWEAYIRAGIAIQNERGALAVAEKRGREQGLKDGREQGLKDGIEKGREDGLRVGVEALCVAFGIEITGARRSEMEGLDAAGLEALLARLREHKSWS